MKYKIGDIAVWSILGQTQYYEVTDMKKGKYKLKLVYCSHGTEESEPFHDWHSKSETDTYSRILTPLEKELL